MLRITTIENTHTMTLRLEGRLEGPWVAVLTQCWDGARLTSRGRRICVDLNGMTFVDPLGRALLAEMHGQGAELVATAIETKATVAEIRAGRMNANNGEMRKS